jgi:hypothetical protein
MQLKTEILERLIIPSIFKNREHLEVPYVTGGRVNR